MTLGPSTEYAVQLAQSGLKVFPLRPTGKEPFPNFRWKDRASNVPHVVETLWAGRETANVAAVIPADVIVLDCDSHEAREALDTVHDLGGTVEIRTPKGYHLWYKWPADKGPSRNTTNLFKVDSGPLVKVDTRGLGGYCVMPPSLVNGLQYKWATSEPEHWRDDLLPAPQWLVDAVVVQKSDREAVREESYFGGPKIGKGGRNAELFRLACKWRDKGMPQPVAKEALLLANRESCVPPLFHWEVIKILQSAWKYKPTSNDYGALNPRRSRGLFRKASEIEETKSSWLLEPYIGLGRATLLAGPGGLGKSRFSIALAAHVSSGKLVDHVGPVEQGPVIIFSAEDNASQNLQPYLRAQGADLEQVYIHETGDDGFTLDSDSLLEINDGIEKIRPKLVVIDPIMSYLDASVDANSGNDANSTLRPLISLAESYDLAMLIVHHTNAGGRIYGSVYWTNSVRCALKLYQDPLDPSQRILAHHKSNHTAKAPSIRYSIQGEHVRWDGLDDEWDDQRLASFHYDPAAEQTILDLMEQIKHEMGSDTRIPVWQIEDIGKSMFARRDWLRIAVMRMEMEMYADPDGKRWYKRSN